MERRKLMLQQLVLHLLSLVTIVVAAHSDDCSVLWARNDTVERIKSPGEFPLNYPPKSDVCWVIRSEKGFRIYVELEYLAIEKLQDTPCNWADFLEIYDGNVSSIPLVTWCGQLPVGRKIISSGSELHIRFRSDDSRNDGGFLLKYHAHPSANPFDPGFEIDFTRKPDASTERKQYFDVNYRTKDITSKPASLSAGEIGAISVGIVASLILAAIVVWQWTSKYKVMKLAAKDKEAMAYMESLISSRPSTSRPHTGRPQTGAPRSAKSRGRTAKSRGERAKSEQEGRESAKSRGKTAKSRGERAKSEQEGRESAKSRGRTAKSSGECADSRGPSALSRKSARSLNESKKPDEDLIHKSEQDVYIDWMNSLDPTETKSRLMKHKLSSLDEREVNVPAGSYPSTMPKLIHVDEKLESVMTPKSERPKSASHGIILKPWLVPPLDLCQRSHSDVVRSSLKSPDTQHKVEPTSSTTEPLFRKRVLFMETDERLSPRSQKRLSRAKSESSLLKKTLKRAALENYDGLVAPPTHRD